MPASRKFNPRFGSGNECSVDKAGEPTPGSAGSADSKTSPRFAGLSPPRVTPGLQTQRVEMLPHERLLSVREGGAAPGGVHLDCLQALRQGAPRARADLERDPGAPGGTGGRVAGRPRAAVTSLRNFASSSRSAVVSPALPLHRSARTRSIQSPTLGSPPGSPNVDAGMDRHPGRLALSRWRRPGRAVDQAGPVVGAHHRPDLLPRHPSPPGERIIPGLPE